MHFVFLLFLKGCSAWTVLDNLEREKGREAEKTGYLDQFRHHSLADDLIGIIEKKFQDFKT